MSVLIFSLFAATWVIAVVIWLNDMNRHILIVPALIIVFVWLTWYGAVASAGSSFAHKTNAIFFFLGSIGLILASTVSAIALWRKTNTYRTYSVLILALSGMMLIGSVWYRTNQHSYVINELESAYNSIAANGSPFPCLLYTSPSPRDQRGSRMPSSA